MQKFFQKIFYIFTKISLSFCLFFLGNQAIFANHPFTDISPSDAYHNAVSDLFEAKIISDDGTHLFRPNELMNRDFYVSLATAIGCKQCLTPTSEDLIKYQNSPFVDLPKTNHFYYCIAYAHDNKITEGYNIDPATQTASCENGEKFSSSPFCAENKISRIEAAAMLLRRAKLWDEQKNSSTFERYENFSDVSNYWYGYAQKAVEFGLISKKSDNSIGQDEKITRGEFALMASKMLEYTQCSTVQKHQRIASYIEIRDTQNAVTHRTIFTQGENFSLAPRTEPGNWKYEWTATKMDGTSEKITGNESLFPGKDLPAGKWFIELRIIDPSTNIAISTPNVTISILPPSQDGHNNLGVGIIPTPSVTYIDNPVTFEPIIEGNPNGNYQYSWDYGDGNRTVNSGGNTEHPYKEPGTYTATLTITDTKTGETAQSSVVIRIVDDKDSDKDGVLDSEDLCPQIKGVPENNGCPKIDAPDYGCSIRGVYSGNFNCNNNNDTDGDGVLNQDDRCPQIPGSKNNFGCPENPNDDSDGGGTLNKDDRCPNVVGPKENFGCPKDSDNDGVFDTIDQCPQIPGKPYWKGCPNPEIYNNISHNVCLLGKLNSTGLITGIPTCNSCPCHNSVQIHTQIRDCDVVFPSILSPEKQTIYSRGNFYLIQ